MKRLVVLIGLLIMVGSLNAQHRRATSGIWAADTGSAPSPPAGYYWKYDSLLAKTAADGVSWPSVAYRQIQSDFLQVVDSFEVDWFVNFISDSSEFALYNQVYPDTNKATNVGADFTIGEGFSSPASYTGIASNFNPTSDAIYYTSDTCFAAFWVTDFKQSTTKYVGANDGGGGQINFGYHTGGNLNARINGTSSTNCTPPTSLVGDTGLIVITRIGSDYAWYFNNVLQGTSTHSGATLIPNEIIGIGGDYQAGFSATIRYTFGLAMFGGFLDADGVESITNAANTYYANKP